MDKQIIIDGVDVKKCVYHESGYCTISKEAYCYCCDKPNCHYKNWQRKEQECEELKTLKDKTYFRLKEEYIQQLDQLKEENKELKKQIDDLLHKPEIQDKILWKIDNEALLGSKDAWIYKLEKNLAEIKEVLQFYNNTTIGADKGNGIFEFEVSNDNVLGGKLICYYDTNPAKKALQKISEVEE